MTEGKVTEVQYLELLRQRLPRGAPSFKSVGAGCDPARVVKRAIKEYAKAEYSWCFCLVDVDQHTTLQEAIALAADNHIEVIVSNPSFELWLVWHLQDFARHVDGSGLKAHLTQHGVLRGKSIDGRFPIDQYPDAIRRARVDTGLATNRVGDNPSCAMPRLLQTLGVCDPVE